MRKIISNHGIPRPEVEIGGVVVTVDGVKVSVGPEVIRSFRRIEAEKRAANASGKPYTKGTWQTKDSAVKAMIIAVAREAGFPNLYDGFRDFE